MAFVYLLTEDDFDDQVYVYLLEMLSGARFDYEQVRLRRGGGVPEVRKKLPLLLSLVRRTGPLEDACFLVALDNDRLPKHGSHAREDATCRHCGLEAAIHQRMPDGRPIPGIVAVPVEMIESWLLLLLDPERFPDEACLPRCGSRAQQVARDVHGATPPPQLKDLVESERRAARQSKAEFALDCVLRLDDASLLAARSPSFALFHAQVARLGFPKPPPSLGT